ncbi:MAG: hypothetical protein ACREU6_07570, partial [Steroidobacteraceae bacterium]
YYESRLARIELDEDEKPRIDAEVNELTEDDPEVEQERFKKKWSTVEALVTRRATSARRSASSRRSAPHWSRAAPGLA